MTSSNPNLPPKVLPPITINIQIQGLSFQHMKGHIQITVGQKTEYGGKEDGREGKLLCQTLLKSFAVTMGKRGGCD